MINDQTLAEREIIENRFSFLGNAVLKINPDVIIRFSWKHEDVTDRAGIYFLVTEKDGLLYIGQSTNIRKRLNYSHSVYRYFMPIVCQTYSIISIFDRLAIEGEMIRRFDPPYNIRKATMFSHLTTQRVYKTLV